MSSMDSVAGAPAPARTQARSQARGWVADVTTSGWVTPILGVLLPAPLWTILIVALSVVVAYELTAHWDE